MSNNQKSLTNKDFTAVPTTATAKKIATTITRVHNWRSVAATEESTIGLARASGRITAFRVLSKAVAGVGETAVYDLKIESTVVTTSVATLDENVPAGTFVAGTIDPALARFTAGQRLRADVTYTAGGGATPLSYLYVEVDVEYDR